MSIIYIDNLLVGFKRLCIGCHIDNQYMGVFRYADDITLICPSKNGLNDMLKIYSKFAHANDIILDCTNP